MISLLLPVRPSLPEQLCISGIYGNYTFVFEGDKAEIHGWHIQDRPIGKGRYQQGGWDYQAGGRKDVLEKY